MSSQALRDNLRLAATVTVVNGFVAITGLSFGYYAALAVLSVTVGNYGNTLELGRQRLIGTAVGAVVVFFGYRAWCHLPVMVALPLALLLARLIAGSMRLTVGYGVCLFVVVMGWLSHDQQLDSWLTLRLFWTAFGILIALLSLRLFWPSRARIQQRQGLLQLLADLGQTFESMANDHAAALLPIGVRRQKLGQQVRSLRTTLFGMRDQRKGALMELGPLAAQHPHARMWDLLDQTCEALILDLDELRRLQAPKWQEWGLQELEAAGVEFAEQVATRLLQWQVQLSHSHQLPLPPAQPSPILRLDLLKTPTALAAAQQLNAEQLTALASRLMVFNRIDHTLESTEQQWRSIAS
ncbi:FUSC family protein [Cyanobium sp. WAJ14-Wanaka]|uniref:FUSC family protein n=1 Tax=Cyanobium sp. WAJ14-Wanaka TaxID=2823725 RepID=UPI0020CCE03B|nr:FUSC family protein [Cyanobium sp. WAJ14-Wanaka]MCP9774255.1 FUSC family protein [Cyanobium sp. WAJ14-Wanaka]